MWLKTSFVFIIHLILCHGNKDFRLGRSKNGNLGVPGDYLGEKVPPAQWFKQKLDHFSPTDLRSWKQVKNQAF